MLLVHHIFSCFLDLRWRRSSPFLVKKKNVYIYKCILVLENDDAGCICVIFDVEELNHIIPHISGHTILRYFIIIYTMENIVQTVKHYIYTCIILLCVCVLYGPNTDAREHVLLQCVNNKCVESLHGD